MRKFIVLAFLIVGLSGVLLLPPRAPLVTGAIPPADVVAITHIIRQEERISVLDSLWGRIEEVSYRVSGYGTRRQFYIGVTSTGTVEANTASFQEPDSNGRGIFYELRKGPSGWEVTNRRRWSDY
jgi:hypothetical protein